MEHCGICLHILPRFHLLIVFSISFFLGGGLLPLFCFLSLQNLTLAHSLSFFYLFSPPLSLSIVFVHSPTIPLAHLSVISLPLLFLFFLFPHSFLSNLFIIMPRLISSILTLSLSPQPLSHTVTYFALLFVLSFTPYSLTNLPLFHFISSFLSNALLPPPLSLSLSLTQTLISHSL